MPGKVPRSRAIAGLLDLHLRKRREALGQRFHDRRSRGRDQFRLQCPTSTPARLSAVRPLPEPEPETCRARTSPIPPPTFSGEQTISSTPRASAPRRRRQYRPSHPPRRLRESAPSRWTCRESSLPPLPELRRWRSPSSWRFADRGPADDLANLTQAREPCARASVMWRGRPRPRTSSPSVVNACS